MACTVYALEKYSRFFIGSKFKIYTDRVSNTFVQTLKFSHGKLYRWSLRLQPFDLEIVRMAGKIILADFLSRIVDTVDHKAPDLTDESSLVFSIEAADPKTQIVRPSVLRHKKRAHA